jgi:hypothetical protein
MNMSMIRKMNMNMYSTMYCMYVNADKAKNTNMDMDTYKDIGTDMEICHSMNNF